MNRRVRVCTVALAAALAACLQIKKFPGTGSGGDAGGDGGGGGGGNGSVTVMMSGSGAGATVTAGGLYTMTFGDSGFHYPSSWKWGADELLGGGGSGCTDENQVGVVYYPAGRMDSLDGAPGATPMLEIELAGPAVAKVKLQWSTNFCTTTGMVSPQGITSFTFFPDGRITRFDRLQQNASSATTTGCHCVADTSQWFVTSYLTLRSQFVSSLDNTAVPGGSALGSAGQFECAIGSGHSIAFGWPMTAYVRSSIASTVSFVLPFFSGATTLPASFDGSGTTTILAAADTDCPGKEARLQAYATNPQLVVNGNPVGVADDGIYGGGQSGGTGGMGVGSSMLTLRTDGTTPIPGGFALWIDFGAPHGSFSVQKTPTPAGSAWYAAEPVMNYVNHAVFWFPDGLQNNETITITPQ